MATLGFAGRPQGAILPEARPVGNRRHQQEKIILTSNGGRSMVAAGIYKGEIVWLETGNHHTKECTITPSVLLSQ